MSAAKCEAGRALGVDCDGHASAIVEYMPAQHRASHATANNRGVYPHNGAVRLRVCEACADELIDEWCERVDQNNPRHMSVTPLDVGFDLRRHEIALSLPTDVEAVRYVDKSGDVQTARGSFDAIASELEAAGYCVARGAS